MTQDNIPPTDPNDSTPPPPPPVVNYDAGALEQDKDARLWGMLAHLSSLVFLAGIPPIVGPLIIWLIKKDQMPFVNDQGREALNFQITVLIASFICVPLVCLGGIGIVLLIAIGVADLILMIVAGVQANSGVYYRYPWAIRLVK